MNLNGAGMGLGNPLFMAVGAFVIAVLLITGAFLQGKSSGRSECALIASEKAREVEQAFNKEQGRKQLELIQQEEKLQVLEGQLQFAAKEDPNAERKCFSAESSKRLNSISVMYDRPDVADRMFSTESR